MMLLCRWLRLLGLSLLGLLLVLSACEMPTWTAAPGPADSAATASDRALVPDSLASNSVTVDSMEAASAQADTGQTDTAQGVAVPPASPPAAGADSVARLLRSLRAEVRRMRTTQESLNVALQSASAASGAPKAAVSAPPATPPPRAADTTAAAAEPDAGGTSLQEARDTARHFGLRLFGAVLVLVIAYFVVRGTVYMLDVLAERSAERRLLYKRIVPIARVLLWTLALYIVLRGIFDVDAQGLIAAATAIGVAVGFAAQDLLKNIFGGLVIIFDQPFQVGDKIEIAGTYGEVVNIGLRSMRIVTPGDNLVSVPNAQVVESAVSNANAGALDCQVTTDLYLPGDSDEGLAKRLAYEAAASAQFVYLEKPIVVMVADEWQERHRLHLKVKAYVLDARHEFRLASEVTERARRAFRAHGLLPPAEAPANGVGDASEPAPRQAAQPASPAAGDGPPPAE